MLNKNSSTTESQRGEREMRRMFGFMKGAAWTTLGIGTLMSLSSIRNFSDENMTLMLGIGFMVGSVFIYTIGTAMHLVEKRRSGQSPA